MLRFDARVASVVSAILISCSIGCGGGEGQGSDFGTGLAIDTNTLSFSSSANESPLPQTVHASISASDAATVEVGYTNGAEQVSWLQASISPGQNPANTAIKFTAIPMLTPGTYTAHPSVAIFKADRTPLAVRSLTVTYTVTAQPASVSHTSIAMRTRFNIPLPTLVQVQIKGTGFWTATVDYISGSGWLREGPRTFPDSGPAPALVQLSPEISTPVGTYAATLHVAIGGQTLDVPVTLEVTP